MQNCTQVSLNIEPEVFSSRHPSEFCLSTPSAKNVYNNILFVIDKSGSNGEHTDSITQMTHPGNDLDMTVRGHAIENYLSDHEDDPYYRWGFIYFSGTEISSFINDGNANLPTFGSAQKMRQALQKFYNHVDDNGTRYGLALDMATSAIKSDLDKHADAIDEEHIYTIFFVSDGRPDADDGGPILSATDPRVEKIKALKDESRARFISLSSVFYNNPGPWSSDSTTAINGLKLMADVGGGTFSEVNNGRINFENLKVGEIPEAWRIKKNRLIVFNLTSAACSDGSIDADSDVDGICDKDEIKYNSDSIFASRLGTSKKFDPKNRNSFSSAYNDSFYWKFELMPTGSGLIECGISQPDEDFDFLNSCEESMIYDSKANGPFDGWLIPGNVANKKNPDSDGDVFLDWIEFSWLRLDSAFSAPVNYTSTFDQYAPNITADMVMAEHRNMLNAALFDKTSYDTTLKFTRFNEKGENCYSFDQKQLALYNTLAIKDKSMIGGYESLVHQAGENKILIYFIAVKDQSPNDEGVLFHTIKTFSYSGAATEDSDPELSISPDLKEFDVYKIPKLETAVEE